MLLKAVLISLAFLIAEWCVASSSSTPSCEQILHQNCSRDEVSQCTMLMLQIYGSCQNLLAEEDTPCTSECRDELKRLDTQAIGRMFIKCQCQGVKCMAYKDRFERCLNGVRCGKKDKRCRRKSCTNVDKKCKKNETCNRRHKKYFEACADLINGYKCTTNCIQATRRYFDFKLKKHTMRERLAKCRCDGTMEDASACYTIRRNREKLCANRLTEV